jgi:transitional endoplasmic reticulum ATPase
MEMSNRPIESLDWNRLAEQTENYSGADIKAVCECATEIPLKESIKTKVRRKISMQDMESAVSSTRSVLKQWFAKAAVQIERQNLGDSFPELVHAARASQPRTDTIVG